jgi:PBSX family phage terminase large subunit
VRVADLFPACPLLACKRPGLIDRGDGTHAHILEVQQQTLDSKAKNFAAVGGYGSGKTLGICVLGNLLSLSVPGNMGIILRQSLPKLHDSTERIFLQILERMQDKTGIGVQFREMRDGFPHRIIYENGAEVLFRPSADLGRFLGPEYGWAYLNEAQEEPEKAFKDLTGRVRLPQASKYLKMILDTNPPHQTHWIAKLFPREGFWTKEYEVNGEMVTTTWEMRRSSTRGNPFLDPEYVAGLMATHDPNEVKKIIEGFYGFSYEGRPVYPQFSFQKHVSDPEVKNLTLIRVWDFGFHNPACTWHQMFKCKEGNLHWTVLHEYVPHELTAEQFALSVDPLTGQARGVLHETQAMFGQKIPLSLIVDGGDAAGAQVTDKGPGPIIRLARPRADGGFNLHFKYRKFPDIDPGLDLIRRCLTQRCKCGYYLLTIHRRCQTVIEGLAGGYHYAQERPGQAIKPKPVKDGYYDNPMDTLRYAGELFYRHAARSGEGLDELERTEQGYANEAHDEDGDRWAWMEKLA